MSSRPARLLSFLELEQWVRPEGSTLKALFDNLRNYPLLAIFFYVSRLLDEQAGTLSTVAGTTIAAYTFLLAMFTVVQTAVLMTSFFVWFIFGPWREQIHEPEGALNLTRIQLVAEGLRVVLFLFFLVITAVACFVTAGKLAGLFAALKPAI